MGREAYRTVNTSWPETIPPLTREEAERAMKKLTRHFKFRCWYGTRRCWVTASPPYGSLNRGWRRLVHDLSHTWFRSVYPNKNPHDPLHARYEAEMLAYVLDKGWLEGTLKPPTKPKGDLVVERAKRIDNRITAWERKLKRAQNALKKLRKQQQYYHKKLS